MNKPRVAVRVDADSTVGLGHLRRCLTLVKQMQGDGFAVRMIGRRPFGEEIESQVRDIPVSWLESELGCNLALAGESADAQATLELVGAGFTRHSWVIVDHYELGAVWETKVREMGHRVLAIDDFRNRLHCADVLVSDTDVPFETSELCIQLLGAQFAIVEPEFAFQESALDEDATGILVTYGGSDPTRETSKALAALRLLRDRGDRPIERVDVVIGPANVRRQELMEIAEHMKNVEVHVAPQSLAPLMRKSRLILTAGGNSMVEALTMRKPCLVTITNDNQSIMVDQLSKRRAVHSLGDHASVSPQDLVLALVNSSTWQQTVLASLQACPIFDQFGAQRISAAMRSISGCSKVEVH